jgi:hypothetical protein
MQVITIPVDNALDLKAVRENLLPLLENERGNCHLYCEY